MQPLAGGVMIYRRMYWAVELTLFALVLILFSNIARGAVHAATVHMDKAQVIHHWTFEKRRAAVPRDFVIDGRGLAYLRQPNGGLKPYGHEVSAQKEMPIPQGKPSSQGDSTPPSIASLDPAQGQEIGESHTFSASVSDASGVRSVDFVIEYPDGVSTQSFSASNAGNNVWSANLQGFSNGNWRWWVVATDSTKRGGNTATSQITGFSVNTSGEPSEPPTPGVITNAQWNEGGAVQSAAGRIYFEMPANKKWKGPWDGYVCSGTVVSDETSGRSIILTAAHCAYDDANKAFARNVLFIPNQADTSGTGTDTNCSNDPMGCWVPSFAVVDQNWSVTTFPNNIPWDYAFYVVSDSGAHEGMATTSDSLEIAAGAMTISFSPPFIDDTEPGPASLDFTHALGYSYSFDPNFMYCAEDMTTEGQFNWWLASCELSGGASGGPWIQPLVDGNGPIISVNSWGYTTSAGMAGPKFNGSSAYCLFTMAISSDWSGVPTSQGDAGIVQSCP